MTTVRELRREDRAAWTELWAGYLRFYRAEVALEVTEQTFVRVTERRDGCFGLAADTADGGLVGFSHCVLHPSTWSRGGTCYLEDLYVDLGHRGTGAARALIEAAGEQGRAAGAETLYWHTQAFNGRARSLYDTVARLTSFVHYERELG
ncbi:MAG TPA: GNAT family N-acetyltransferase [Solirubrobacteraceae bacterium]|jgi:GNAT superfamily N-acetyltransferase|nr:GNAT family N-acetyltransferase [Solirubrobacteraceae bacterium]